jgi:hypothetical protein
MRLTSEAMSLFTKALIEGHKGGETGSENLSLLPDTTLNLQVREGLRKLTGQKLTPEQVQKLEKSAYDGGKVTDEEAVYLLKLGLDESNFEHKSVDGKVELTPEARAARFDLVRFAVLQLGDIDIKAGATEHAAANAANAQVMREYIKGTIRAVVSTGQADPAYLAAARKVSETQKAKAAVADLSPTASPREILKVFLQETEAIGGWSFLKKGETHNVLVKPGINWGINGYPSVSSWQSVYSAALATQLKGAAAGANVKVTVADESGIENKAFGTTTMDNMESTGILGGAVLAGVENSFIKVGMKGDAAHDAAVKSIADALTARGVKLPPNPTDADVAPLVRRGDKGLIDRAQAGGVVIIPLDEQPTMILKPVSKGPDEKLAPNETNMTPEQLGALKHFTQGIRVSSALADVTDIINLPKPPGRHGIMSNCGLTGAVKNYIGLMSGVDRGESLHSPWARTPPRRDDETPGSYQDRLKVFVNALGDRGVSRADVEAQGPVRPDSPDLGNWQAHEDELLKTAGEWVENMKSEGQKLADTPGNEAEGPGQQFFEKLGELNLYFKSKERFVFTDMRETVASFGPDFGEKITVGKAIASDSAPIVDALGSAALKEAYQQQHGWKFGGSAEFSELEQAPKGIAGLGQRLLARVRDTLSHAYREAQGAGFLRGGDPFALKNHAAMMSYPGLTPTGMQNVDLKMAPESIANSRYLGKRDGSS